MILLRGMAYILLFMAGWYVGDANWAAFAVCGLVGFFGLFVSYMDEGKRNG